MSIIRASKMTDELVTEIRCRNTGRLLAKLSSEGLHLFCRQEKQQHLITWDQLENLRKDYKEDIRI